MRRTFVAAPDFRPFAQMNTTPLIDVLLVLLIMFILTIPAQTHKVGIDLPAQRPGPASMPETHRLAIAADGALSWDGAAIPDAELAARLRALSARPDAMLQLESAAEARYARFDAVLAEIKRAGIARLGFVGNDRFTI
ncbi:ExbD/TolR family protein [Sphingomonas sp.]|uniref:ExbD/TolR family protein n=1 Tax=Sphingomonas sp. TaxID=28214 RepID=UPI002DB97E53|nr:biopolymer transporter ExbD [Sphingomonas sp.]HEU4970280.1 biopolymer transporter ExbD [Sphingomonas sp.]